MWRIWWCSSWWYWGSASSYRCFWSGAFRGRAAVDPSEGGPWKRTGRRGRFAREGQDAEQTNISTSAKALFAEVYSLTITCYSRISDREHSARLLLIDDRVGLLSSPGMRPCLIKRCVAKYIRDQDDVIVEVPERPRKRKAFCPSMASRSSERMLCTASITAPGGTSRSGKG